MHAETLKRDASAAQKGFQRAKWIWIKGEAAPRNTVAEFHCRFRAQGPKPGGRLLISADSRYTAWLNGERIGFGPARNFPKHYEFDLHDLTRLLRRGENQLAIRVQHWGEGNIQSFVSRAGLIAEVADEAGRVLTATNSSWKARLSPSFRRITPRVACQMPFEEQVTAEETDWLDARCAHWPAAVEIGPAGCEPWGALTPRSIPHLTDEPWECVSLSEAGIASDPALVLSLRAGPSLVPEQLSMNLTATDGIFATVLHVPRAGRLWIKHASMYSGPVSFVLDGENLPFEQDEFDMLATHQVSAGKHLLLMDWKGLAHDLDVGLALGGIAGLKQERFGGFKKAAWIMSTKPGKNRAKLRRCKNLNALLAGASTWQAVTADAVPERDVYMSMTCRTLENGATQKSTTLPWSGNPVSAGRHHRLILDFGRHANGFIELKIDAGKGTQIDAAGVEGINLGRIQFTELNNNTFSYLCREGKQTFTSQLVRGLRYLVVDVRPLGRVASIAAARVRVATYPWQPKGSFRCSDTRLNQIYELSSHTLRMSSMDTFIDATYEHALWVGDMASMTLQVHHYVQGERLLPERCLRLAAQSLERMPLVNSQVPSAWEDRPIPNWSFLWAMGVRDHFLFTGDRRFAREMLPALEQQAAFIQESLDAEGLFAMHGEVWHFLDWNGCENDHRHAASRTYAHENALAIASLKATAEVASTLGKPAIAHRWTQLAAKMTRTMRQTYWLPKANAFGETRAAGRTTTTVTASTQICALMAGLFPQKASASAVQQVLDTDGAWLPTGTPWMWSLGARLACEAGHAASVLPGIRRHWGKMLDRGATTAWEMFEGGHRAGLPTRSWCHGWSAGPAWLLPAYVLGVRPLEPGWSKVTLDPQAADLQWAEGTIPTPHGPIHVRWERLPNGQLSIHRTLPPGVQVVPS